MLGQPAASQTVCRPSRRTSDFSSVYSGPVLRRVLIHSGLRSIGTWLLRTSRRRSLRPAGSSGDPEECAGAAVSLMISTVPPTDDAPAACSGGVLGSGDADQTCLSSGPAVGPVSPAWPLVKGCGASLPLTVASSGPSPSASWASRTPMSDSAGAESLGVSMAVETVLPESLGELATGSSR